MSRASSTAYVNHADTPLGAALALVADELSWAMGHFAAINSGHEGKAVIEEELEELWAHVTANRAESLDAGREAVQIAAMALRYLLDLGQPLRLYDLGMRPEVIGAP